MTDDATLSDFASADGDSATTESSEDGDEAAHSDAEGSSGGSESAAGEPETDEAIAATDERVTTATTGTGFSTYAWGEYTCSQCDAATDRVWRDDDGLVCPNCKAW